MDHRDKRAATVVQPDEGESFWQPVPANGYAEVRISPKNVPSNDKFSMGIQVIAPGCHIRGHWHAIHEELLFFFEGTGKVIIDGVEHRVVPGTSVYLPPWNKHTIISDEESELKMMWLLMPGGIEDFFEAIGRPRAPGEPAPAPFPRPDNVEEIEANTVFTPLDAGPPPGRG